MTYPEFLELAKTKGCSITAVKVDCEKFFAHPSDGVPYMNKVCWWGLHKDKLKQAQQLFRGRTFTIKTTVGDYSIEYSFKHTGNIISDKGIRFKLIDPKETIEMNELIASKYGNADVNIADKNVKSEILSVE
jgi:hypothetical protein